MQLIKWHRQPNPLLTSDAMIWWYQCRFCCIPCGCFSRLRNLQGKQHTFTWPRISSSCWWVNLNFSVISQVQVHIDPWRWIGTMKGFKIQWMLPFLGLICPPSLPPRAPPGPCGALPALASVLSPSSHGPCCSPLVTAARPCAVMVLHLW